MHFGSTPRQPANTVEIRQHCPNLDNDLIRHRYIIRFHTIDGFLFLIRFIILCTDLSAASTESGGSMKAFIAFIFLFELIGGLSILLADILYLWMTYAGHILYETDNDDIPYYPRKPLLRLSTLTCFTFDCYYEHPHAVLLTRVGILAGCFLLRFVAFILGATCASRYAPRAVAYTVFAALSFIPSIVTMVLEYRHHRRLWNYYPDGESNAKRHQAHHRFMPYSIINDQRTSSWRSSLCKRPEPCTSRNLYHILLYHSGATQYRDDVDVAIGFHQTKQTHAFGISKTGFQISQGGMIGPGVYFATCIDHTEFKANHRGAYICARIHMGRILRTTNRWDPQLNSTDYDTVYFEHPNGSDEFCVKDPRHIEEWIIVVNQDDSQRRAATDVRDSLKDHFYGETYEGCIF